MFICMFGHLFSASRGLSRLSFLPCGERPPLAGKVILGDCESSKLLKIFSFIFPKILDAIQTYYKSKNFSDSSLHNIFES